MGKKLMGKNLMDENLADIEKVFLHDVNVPDIVQTKAYAAFSSIKTERGQTMRKESRIKKKTFTRLLIGATACAAIAVSVAKGSFRQFTASNATDKTANDTILSTMDNMFTMHVAAAELTKKHPVPISNVGQDSDNDMAINNSYAGEWGMSTSEGNNSINYYISMPLSCTGNNIEKITYSINNGAIQVVQPEDESIIVDGQLFGRELNTGFIGGDFDEGNDGLPSRAYKIVHYQSITLDYEKQSDPFTWINICNEVTDSEEVIDLIWGTEEYNEESYVKALRQILGDTAITCTVQYVDGTTQSADILMDAKIMTYSEAGIKVANPNDKSVFITFELQ